MLTKSTPTLSPLSALPFFPYSMCSLLKPPSSLSDTNMCLSVGPSLDMGSFSGATTLKKID